MARMPDTLYVRDMIRLRSILQPHVWADVVKHEGDSVIARMISETGARVTFRTDEETIARVRAIVRKHGAMGPPEPTVSERPWETSDDARPWERPGDWWKQPKE